MYYTVSHTTVHTTAGMGSIPKSVRAGPSDCVSQSFACMKLFIPLCKGKKVENMSSRGHWDFHLFSTKSAQTDLYFSFPIERKTSSRRNKKGLLRRSLWSPGLSAEKLAAPFHSTSNLFTEQYNFRVFTCDTMASKCCSYRNLQWSTKEAEPENIIILTAVQCSWRPLFLY